MVPPLLRGSTLPLTARIVGTVLLFSLIALGLAADLTTTSMRAFGVHFSFADLAIATAVLSFLTLPAM